MGGRDMKSMSRHRLGWKGGRDMELALRPSLLGIDVATLF